MGSGPYAQEMADVASDAEGYRLVGFVENWNRERCRERLNGLPIHWIDDIAGLAADHWAICSLATTKRSLFVEQVAAAGMPFATIVHPKAHVSATSTLAEGTFLSPGVIVAAHSRLGRHVRVNRGSLIGHHTTIDDYVTIQPGVNIAGCCQIGRASYLGVGVVVIDRVNIGAQSVISAGSLVTKDVPDHAQVAGAPARFMKRNIDGK